MSAKFLDFETFLHETHCSVFALTETWLNESIPNSLVNIDDYQIFRRDRGSLGGGLLIYVHKNIKAEQLQCNINLNYPGFEQLWINLICGKKAKIAVAAVYRPNHISTQCLQDLDAMIRHVQLNITNDIVVLGDFNINILSESPTRTLLNNLLNDLSLTQLINEPTRITENTATCIDLIIVNNSLPVHCSDTVECSLSDHWAVSCSIDQNLSTNSSFKRIIRDFSNFNSAEFNSDLEGLNWNRIYYLTDINDKVAYYNSCILNIFNKHAPYKLITINNVKRAKPWFTFTLRKLRNIKINAFNRYKRTHLDAHKRYYCDVRNYYNFALREEKKQFYNNVISKHIKNPKKLWPALKQSIPSGLQKQGHVSLNLMAYDANAFNDYFTDSVQSFNLQPDQSYLLNFFTKNYDEKTFSYSPVTENTVQTFMFKQKPSAIGSDHISAKMMQLCSRFCVLPLTHIINYSFDNGIVPDSWKTSVSVPIPKNNTPRTVCDFRNISLQCVQSKIAESILQEQMRSYIDAILPPQQSAFRQNYSTTTLCVSVVDDILKEYDRGNITALVMLDMTKAFDCLNHDLLLAKLSHYGFNAGILSWFSSYFSNRKQYVRLDEFHISDLREVRSGVPQGSILGPLLFNLYIADLSRSFESSKFYLYADDIQLFSSFNNENAQQCISSLNSDLDNVNIWARQNCLRLNPSKSQVIMIGPPHILSKCESLELNLILDSEIIPADENPRNLGLVLDRHLSFDKQVNYLCRTSYLRLKVLYPLRSLLTEKVRHLLVESLIMSHFNYGDCVYGPCLTQANRRRLQVAQNHCVRFITNVPHRGHITPYIRSLNMIKLHERRFIHYVLLVTKIVNTKTPSYLYDKIEHRASIHGLNLRHDFLTTVPYHRTERFKVSFSYLSSYILNIMTPFVQNKGITHIKRSLKDCLLSGNLPDIDVTVF